ncbi:uncharacterized protein LY89DRAFT_715572 [Mollisia scopiformis]|uniref:2EXR domain-containing protein n=1 Tax=Mollisia scopiformis TaxID=149040 RepID=A0A194XM99_MOLSC|nr:uncharacterized protein LY89DRAFT_715572 [Mollisia scopiformis]KUJ21375.1 hypothetical protein LY89DRAFT_715572 [Mollisia scopiformis]
MATHTFTCFPLLPPEIRHSIVNILSIPISSSGSAMPVSGLFSPLPNSAYVALNFHLETQINCLQWAEASNVPRNLDIRCSEQEGRYGYENREAISCRWYKSTQRPPSVLSVNRESRSIAVKYYELSFGEVSRLLPTTKATIQAPATIWYNRNADRLCPMGDFSDPGAKELWFSNGAPPSCALNVIDLYPILDSLLTCAQGFAYSSDLFLYWTPFHSSDIQHRGQFNFSAMVEEQADALTWQILLHSKDEIVKQSKDMFPDRPQPKISFGALIEDTVPL